MSDGGERVPDWLVERLAAGDLTATEAERVRARLRAENGDDAGVDQQLAALARSNEEILAAHPPATVAAEVKRRRSAASPAPERRASPGSRFLASGLVLAAGAVLIVALRPGAPPETGLLATGDEIEETTIKGLEPHLLVFLKTKDGPVKLNAGQAVRPGDVLQLRYVSARRSHGVIASVDARGTVTWHLPTRPGEAVPLDPNGETTLPEAFELDDSPGFERFVFVTGQGPFSTDVVEAALRPDGPPLPSHLIAHTFVVHKESP